VEQQELSLIASGNAKWCSLFGRQFGSFLQNYILFPYDPKITLLVTYSNELKMYVHRKPWIWMFIAVLFIIAKTWKQQRCPSVGNG
jgi:hypothetical protein